MNYSSANSVCRFVQALLAAAAIVLLGPSASAQQPDLDTLARDVAEKIHSAGKKKVAVAIVFDCPIGSCRAAGKELAAQFSSLLAKHAQGFTVADKESLLALRGNGLMEIDTYQNKVARLLALRIGADAFVSGEIVPGPDKWRLTVRVLEPRKNKKLAQRAMGIHPEPYIVGLVDKPVADRVTGVMLAGTGGLGFATCIWCPHPEYSDEGIEKKVQGSVFIGVTATVDGQAADLVVIQSLGFGLDEEALKAVSRWRLKPVNGLDGKPVATRNFVEVNFRIGGGKRNPSSEAYPECIYCPLPEIMKDGKVLLRALITEQGIATEIEVVKSGGQEMDESAIRAVKQWRFRPVRGPDGKPIAFRYVIELNFRVH